MKIGFIGCGNMGTGHAKNFLEGKINDAYVAAVCDVNPKKFEFFKENFGDTIEYFSDAKEMFEHLCIVNIHFSKSIPLTPLHWMISDQKKSIVVELFCRFKQTITDEIGEGVNT